MLFPTWTNPKQDCYNNLETVSAKLLKQAYTLSLIIWNSNYLQFSENISKKDRKCDTPAEVKNLQDKVKQLQSVNSSLQTEKFETAIEKSNYILKWKLEKFKGSPPIQNWRQLSNRTQMTMKTYDDDRLQAVNG